MRRLVATILALICVGGAAACTTSVAGVDAYSPIGTAGATTTTAAPVVPQLRPARAGTLPADGTVTVGGVTLTGRRIREDTDNDGKPDGAVVMWVTDTVLVDAGTPWRALAARFAATGLYPLVLQAEQTDPDNGSPWTNGQVALEQVTDPDTLAVGTVLPTMYREQVHQGDPSVYSIPYGRTFPGLAPTPPGDRGDVIDAASTDLPGRIGLVAVTRPADVPATIGWLGATNYYDAGYVTAVLRSWEDRFGARLLRMGVDYLELAVSRPPTTEAQAARVAAEHLALCPDEIYQGDYDDFPQYAHSLVGATTWYCDWD